MFKPSPDYWNPPRKDFLKLNFDGASKGNLGKVGYGSILHNNKGKMLGYGYGFLGIESNNAGEIEGLIQGLRMMLGECWLPAMVEGDLKVIIQMTKQLANRQTIDKVSLSWRLASRFETLRHLVLRNLVVSFHHVRRRANQVGDLLANVGVGKIGVKRMGRLEDFGMTQWVPKCQ